MAESSDIPEISEKERLILMARPSWIWFASTEIGEHGYMNRRVDCHE